jgi:hypothetical protein
MESSTVAIIFVGLAAQGLAYALIGFPIAWLMMPKEMKSERFSGAKWGYVSAMVLVPVLTALGLFGLQDTPQGPRPSTFAPALGVMVCMLLVSLTRAKNKT